MAHGGSLPTMVRMGVVSMTLNGDAKMV